jgi:predicted molibdopterin-dependent oxidoreductase YjgC
MPASFPGYQHVADEEIRKKFERGWGVPLPGAAGMDNHEMVKAIHDGKLRAIYLAGEDMISADSNSNDVGRAIEKLDFLVVQDIFMSETARLADVVLPGVSFAEKDGTFTNTERKVKRVRKAVEPIGSSRQDWEIICDLSTRMGYPMHYDDPSKILEEVAQVTPSYGGIYYDRIETEGLHWPCPNRAHPGTPYLHKDRFSRGLGLFHAIEYLPPEELPDKEYPYLLTTGRIYVHYHTGTMTRRSPSLNKEVEEGFAEINPRQAKEVGIIQGERIKVFSRRGEIEIKADLSERMEGNTIFIPFHFVESAANRLTNPAFDPIAQIPEFKVCAVKIEVIPKTEGVEASVAHDPSVA